MRPAVRLTRRPDGGFRLEGITDDAIEGVPRDGGFRVYTREACLVTWDAATPGWVLVAEEGGRELGRTTPLESVHLSSPSSLLLSDGRLFRLALAGASDPHFEVGLWDQPGTYVIGRADGGGWTLERTAAGRRLEAGPELWILAGAELGRLDGWWGAIAGGMRMESR
ncbi:MAG TPA: hypothetical protein VFV19_04295 [Candidatus Polarisedimenticolaceae bacterium]|nr:hypothetical protein [Candidatus Polarisedimenticolaceae bacterium]